MVWLDADPVKFHGCCSGVRKDAIPGEVNQYRLIFFERSPAFLGLLRDFGKDSLLNLAGVLFRCFPYYLACIVVDEADCSSVFINWGFYQVGIIEVE